MWYFKGKKITKIEQFPENSVGFIYCIENLDNGRKYIGKKILCFKRRVKTTKKDRTISKKKSKLVISDSGWLGYTGSSAELNSDILKGDKIKKTILRICHSKAEMSYYEAKEIFLRECLEKTEYYNKWISVRINQKLL